MSSNYLIHLVPRVQAGTNYVTPCGMNQLLEIHQTTRNWLTVTNKLRKIERVQAVKHTHIMLISKYVLDKRDYTPILIITI